MNENKIIGLPIEYPLTDYLDDDALSLSQINNLVTEYTPNNIQLYFKTYGQLFCITAEESDGLVLNKCQ